MNKNILYIGDSKNGSTSNHRARALQRIGHFVMTRDPYAAHSKMLQSGISGPFHYHTGYRYLQKMVNKWTCREISGLEIKPDLIWVNSGELLGAEALKILKELNVPILLYNNDDPTGKRDGRRFNRLLTAIPFYDLCVVMRNENINEFKERGAGHVLRVMMSYDEIEHAPFESSESIPAHFRSEVAFIGTWMKNEKRDDFLLYLIKNGIPVSIWGNRWQKSKNWNKLKPFYKGASLSGKEYVAAIQGSKICVGLLSKGNRDLHTQRSFEIPYAGGLLCAQRTTEHLLMYREDEEAVFWDNPEECAVQCKKLLADHHLRENIRAAGMKRVRELKAGNENICKKILDELDRSFLSGKETKIVHTISPGIEY